MRYRNLNPRRPNPNYDIGRRPPNKRAWKKYAKPEHTSVHIRGLPECASEGNVYDWCLRTVWKDHRHGGQRRKSSNVISTIWMGKPVTVCDGTSEEMSGTARKLRYAHVTFMDPTYATSMLARADPSDYDGLSEPTVSTPDKIALEISLKTDTRGSGTYLEVQNY